MIDIRRLVSRQALWCILPAPTDRLFARYREHSFVRMVLGSWPLLIMALVLAGLSGPQLLGADIVGRDALYWWRGLALLGVILSAGIMLLHFRTCHWPLFCSVRWSWKANGSCGPSAMAAC
ncbi:MAG: hypothetical protein IT466_01840 [Moraxellaceae bacterium]|nr:hypothetical protein [Moraxellaceae bacterium]